MNNYEINDSTKIKPKDNIIDDNIFNSDENRETTHKRIIKHREKNYRSFLEECLDIDKSSYSNLEYNVMINNKSGVYDNHDAIFYNGKLCNGHLKSNRHPEHCKDSICYKTAVYYALKNNCRIYKTIVKYLKYINSDCVENLFNDIRKIKCECTYKKKYCKGYKLSYLNCDKVHNILTKYLPSIITINNNNIDYNLESVDTCIHNIVNSDVGVINNDLVLQRLSSLYKMYNDNVDVLRKIINQQNFELVQFTINNNANNLIKLLENIINHGSNIFNINYGDTTIMDIVVDTGNTVAIDMLFRNGAVLKDSKLKNIISGERHNVIDIIINYKELNNSDTSKILGKCDGKYRTKLLDYLIKKGDKYLDYFALVIEYTTDDVELFDKLINNIIFNEKTCEVVIGYLILNSKYNYLERFINSNNTPCNINEYMKIYIQDKEQDNVLLFEKLLSINNGDRKELMSIIIINNRVAYFDKMPYKYKIIDDIKLNNNYEIIERVLAVNNHLCSNIIYQLDYCTNVYKIMPILAKHDCSLIYNCVYNDGNDIIGKVINSPYLYENDKLFIIRNINKPINHINRHTKVPNIVLALLNKSYNIADVIYKNTNLDYDINFNPLIEQLINNRNNEHDMNVNKYRVVMVIYVLVILLMIKS